jgi:hypothetical protein
MSKDKIYKTPEQKKLTLREISRALEYGSVKADRRIQVVMPSEVVNALDQEFPNVNRSKLLTRLAVDALLAKLKYKDSPELKDWIASEQDGLDEMWDYLEERESE